MPTRALQTAKSSRVLHYEINWLSLLCWLAPAKDGVSSVLYAFIQASIDPSKRLVICHITGLPKEV